LRECQGDYIQWLDADDLLAPDKIERQMAFAETSEKMDVLYASAWGTFYYRPHKAKFRPTPLWQDLDAVEWLILRLSNPWMMHPSSWLVSRWLTDQAGPWDERLVRNQDGEYFFRIVSSCNFVKFIPESCCYYRKVNPSSVSSLRSRKVNESICLSIDLETRHVLERENSERTRRACISRLNVGVSILASDTPDLADNLRERIIDLGGEFVPKSTSMKYAFAKVIIGDRNARFLKNLMWKIHRRIYCSIDRWLFKFSRIGS
jgi:glycosyltransferase involved in cell wall biosynthesis